MESMGAGADLLTAVAVLLRNRREQAGMSQEALATQLGKDQPWISKTELGTRRVQLVELLAWLQALGLTMTDVADEIDEIWRRYRP